MGPDHMVQKTLTKLGDFVPRDPRHVPNENRRILDQNDRISLFLCFFLFFCFCFCFCFVCLFSRPLKPGFHIVVSVVSVVRKKFIGQIKLYGNLPYKCSIQKK